MVGLMADDNEIRIKSLINCVTFAIDNSSKLDYLHQLTSYLHQDKLGDDDASFSRFLPSLLKLVADEFSPVRKCVSEVIGEVGLKHLELLPEIIPALLTVVDDDIPAVARQAITSGTSIYCCTLEKIAIQGLYASKLDESLESAWEWVVKLKEKIYSIAFKSDCDGVQLLALKFVAAIVLIYTPDPNGNAEPPPHLTGDGCANGKDVGFSISWLRRGHPILKLGDLSIEASRSLGLLLDQLRLPILKSLSTSMVVVLINCEAGNAERPSKWRFGTDLQNRRGFAI